MNICVTNDHVYVPLVVSTSQSFPHSCLITGFVTRLTWWVSLVEQELLTLLEHLSSPLVFSGVLVTRSLVFCVMFCKPLCVHLSVFLLAIVLFVLLWFMDSDYPFDIFKLFLWNRLNNRCKDAEPLVNKIIQFYLLTWKNNTFLVCKYT
jgi:hypothetical protein